MLCSLVLLFYFLDSISIAVIFLENRLPVSHEMQTSDIPTGLVMSFLVVKFALFSSHRNKLISPQRLIS